jgi:hypothetical protein
MAIDAQFAFGTADMCSYHCSHNVRYTRDFAERRLCKLCQPDIVKLKSEVLKD